MLYLQRQTGAKYELVFYTAVLYNTIRYMQNSHNRQIISLLWRSQMRIYGELNIPNIAISMLHEIVVWLTLL